MNIDVLIIIVNYNTLELTKNTINSILEKTKGLNYEIILVNNTSIECSVKFLKKIYKNKIILYFNFWRKIIFKNNKKIEKIRIKINEL